MSALLILIVLVLLFRGFSGGSANASSKELVKLEKERAWREKMRDRRASAKEWSDKIDKDNERRRQEVSRALERRKSQERNQERDRVRRMEDKSKAFRDRNAPNRW